MIILEVQIMFEIIQIFGHGAKKRKKRPFANKIGAQCACDTDGDEGRILDSNKSPPTLKNVRREIHLKTFTGKKEKKQTSKLCLQVVVFRKVLK